MKTRARTEESTTRDTGLGCDANVSYQPTWEVLISLLPGIISIRLILSMITIPIRVIIVFVLRGTLIFLLACNYGLTGLILSVMVRISVKGEDDEMLWNASATWRFLKRKKQELSAYWVDI